MWGGVRSWPGAGEKLISSDKFGKSFISLPWKFQNLHRHGKDLKNYWEKGLCVLKKSLCVCLEGYKEGVAVEMSPTSPGQPGKGTVSTTASFYFEVSFLSSPLPSCPSLNTFCALGIGYIYVYCASSCQV